MRYISYTCLLTVVVVFVNSFRNDISVTKDVVNKHQLCMLSSSDTDGPKKRIISPNDISSLFNSNSKGSNKVQPSNFIDENDDNDDYNDIYDDEDDDNVTEEENNQTALLDKADLQQKDSTDLTRDALKLSESNFMKEMVKLEQMVTQNTDLPSKNSNVYASTDDMESPDDDDLEYANLEKRLDDKVSRSVVAKALSMSSSTTSSRNNLDIGPRVVKYDPSGFDFRLEKMNYGAYRRWKVVEEDKKSKGKLGKPGSRKKKGSGKNAAEKFYDAIKNLGSGPASSGSKTSTGVAEPPPNKGPIQPKKAPLKKSKKRVITPDDIDSLFSSSNSGEISNSEADASFSKNALKNKPTENDRLNKISSSSNVYSSDDDDDDDDEDESDVDTEDVEDKTNMKKFFDPLNEEIPKWLDDAAKDSKKSLKKSKKSMKLVNDWRFWGAIIAVAAFTSAYWTVTQQNAMSDFNTAFNTLNPSQIVPSSNGDELVI